MSAPTSTQAEHPTRVPALPWRAWLFVFAFFLTLYAMTASRGVQWQDSGSHMLRIVTGELVNPRGLALSHPLHHRLGRAAVGVGMFPPAFAITLVSCVAAAIAVANTFGCIWSLTGRGWASWYGCCSLGVAHTFWQMATVTETYTLVCALLSGEVWALIHFLRRPARGPLWLVFGLGGLGVANHNLGALTLPVVGVVAILAVRRRTVGVRDVGIGVIFWLLGSLSYSALIVSEVGRSGDFGGTIALALFGNVYRSAVLNVSISPVRMSISAAFALLNFPGLLLPLAAVAMFRRLGAGCERSVWRVLLAGFVVHAVFAIRYPVVDQHTFFLPSYVFLAIFGGVGWGLLAGWGAGRGRGVRRAAYVFLVLTPLIYAAVPGVARRMNVLEGHLRHKPFRDDYTYVFTPWSVAETSAERMSERAVMLAGDRGLIVIEDSMSRPAVLFKLWTKPQRMVTVTGEWDPNLALRAVGEGRTVVYVPSSTQSLPPSLSQGRRRRDGELYVFENDG